MVLMRTFHAFLLIFTSIACMLELKSQAFDHKLLKFIVNVFIYWGDIG